VIQSGDIIYAYGTSTPEPASGFVFTNNLVRHNSYGITGDGAGPGNAAIAAYLPGATIRANAVACPAGNGSCLAGNYPAGNTFLTEADWQAQFIDFAGGDYHLASGSGLRAAGSDGKAIGADLSAIAAAAQRSLKAPNGLRVITIR
jgi:hypothetical protein